MRSLSPTAWLLALFAASVVISTPALIPPAQASAPGLSGLNFCINLFQSGREGSPCTFDRDCSADNVCFEAECVPPEYAEAIAWRGMGRQRSEDEKEEGERQFRGADPLPDDGGADAACGRDRRCRIERLASRNRARRHYDIARQEQAVHQEVDRILTRRRESVLRAAKPWAVAYQRHSFGLGIFGGWTFASHFRAEATLVYQDRWISYIPDDSSAPAVDGFHRATFGTLHLTYLPSRAWFSPIVSAGFGMGRGSYGAQGNLFRATPRPGTGQSPEVRYHYVSAAIGAEAQFEVGLIFRVAYRHGRLLYNQVRHGPGSYELDTRRSLREYMNTEGLAGVDFSIGWTF